MPLNDVFLHQEQGHKKILVFFSAASARNFTGYKLVSDLPIDKLFIRDPHRSWYNNNVVDGWANIDELLSMVQAVTRKYSQNDVYFVGGSMGGYAAILAACKLGYPSVLAFSPQIVLDSALPNTPARTVQTTYQNLAPIVHGSNTDVQILVGTEDVSDVFHMRAISASNNVRISEIANAPHNTMHYLKEKNLLLAVIRNYIEGTFSRFKIPSLGLFQETGIVSDISEACIRYFKNDLQGALGYISPYREYFGLTAPIFLNALVHAKLGNVVEAIGLFETASPHVSHNDDFFYQKALVEISLRKYDQALKSLDKSISLAPETSATHLHKKGVCHFLKGDLDTALICQRRAIEISPNHPLPHYQLGIISLKRGDWKAAREHFERTIGFGNTNPLARKHLATALVNLAVEDILRGRGPQAKKQLLAALNTCPDHMEATRLCELLISQNIIPPKDA